MRSRWLVAVVVTLMIAVPATVVQAAGTRENPVPFGKPGLIGLWQIKVIDVNLDAYDYLADREDAASFRPATGNVFALVRVEATYVGNDVGSIWLDVIGRTIGPSGVVYDEDSYCPFYSDRTSEAPDVFPGEAVEVNYCFEVSKSDANGLLIYFKKFIGKDLTFFSLEEPVGTPVASPKA